MQLASPGSARPGRRTGEGRSREGGAPVLKARGLLPLEAFNSPPTRKTQTSGQGVALGPEAGGGLPCGEAHCSSLQRAKLTARWGFP